MDKKDLVYVVVALVIILVLALVIKPLMTGQPMDTGLPVATTPQTPVITVIPTAGIINTPIITPSLPTPTPTPVPTWDSASSTAINFVNPSQYGITLNQSLPGGSRFDTTVSNQSTVVYSTISGQYSGTTDIVNIPFPYWELWYTADTETLPGGKDQKLSTSTVTGSKEVGAAKSGVSIGVIQGSYSVVFPQFVIEVMDGDDPNRVVRSITPPGGLDSSLWKEKKTAGYVVQSDPRPWKEKFYEGQRNYFFVIHAQALKSYKLEIRVPYSYVGKY